VRSDYQIVLANPNYRQKLGANLPTDYFDTVGQLVKQDQQPIGNDSNDSRQLEEYMPD
jgi:hypothetical protein